MEKLKRLLLVSRPISWPNTAYPFAAGYLVSGGNSWLIGGLMTLYFLFPYNLLMYGVNDVFDYESDIKNPRKGGIEGMREQRAFHPFIIRAVLLTNIPFVLWTTTQINLSQFMVLLAILFLVVAYSLAILRFKERPVIDSMTSSMHFVGPLIFGLSLTGSLDSRAWPYLAAFFLWGMASHAFGAVQDIIPDRQAKISSIATFFGAQLTTRLAFILYILASAILIAISAKALVVGLTGLIYAINIFSYLDINDKTSATTNTAWRRFIWLNFITGAVVTMALLANRYIN